MQKEFEDLPKVLFKFQGLVEKEIEHRSAFKIEKQEKNPFFIAIKTC